MTREQFTQAVLQTQEPLRRFLLALCLGDSATADDLAQDAYMKAYLALESLRDTDKFRAWLFRIAYNGFVSSRRSQRPQEDLDTARGLEAAESSDTRFRYQELYEALGRLTAAERTAILLYYMQGYSTAETAGILECTEPAVRQYLSRGRKHLKNLLTS